MDARQKTLAISILGAFSATFVGVLYSDFFLSILAFFGINPKSPTVIQVALLAAAIGLLVGFLLGVHSVNDSMIANFLQDRRLRNLMNYKDEFDVPFVGWVPETKWDPQEIILHPKSIHFEAVTNIVDAASFQFQPDERLMMITSVGEGQGKSVLCLSVAAIHGRLGKRVLIIDADLRSPMQHRRLEFPNHIGVTTFAAGAPPLEECIYHTRLENVWLMPSGRLTLPPFTALMQFLNRNPWPSLLEKFDQIIVDSPPVLGIADAPALARSVGNVLFVLRHQQIRTAQVQLALQRLRLAGGDIKIVMAGVGLPVDSYRAGYSFGSRSFDSDGLPHDLD